MLISYTINAHKSHNGIRIKPKYGCLISELMHFLSRSLSPSYSHSFRFMYKFVGSNETFHFSCYDKNIYRYCKIVNKKKTEPIGDCKQIQTRKHRHTHTARIMAQKTILSELDKLDYGI